MGLFEMARGGTKGVLTQDPCRGAVQPYEDAKKA